MVKHVLVSTRLASLVQTVRSKETQKKKLSDVQQHFFPCFSDTRHISLLYNTVTCTISMETLALGRTINEQQSLSAISAVQAVPLQIQTYDNQTVPKKKNSVALVRERTIPTEQPPPVGEVSANFCG